MDIFSLNGLALIAIVFFAGFFYKAQQDKKDSREECTSENEEQEEASISQEREIEIFAEKIQEEALGKSLDKPAFRQESKGTGDNRDAMLNAINSSDCIKFTLFATLREDRIGCNSVERSNLPILMAIAEYDDKFLVFDSAYLTAAREPRYYEVKAILDSADKSNKVQFCNMPVEYTGCIDVDISARYLLKEAELYAYYYSSSSRENFFSMLSNVPESQFN